MWLLHPSTASSGDEVHQPVPAGGSFRISTRVLGGVTTHQLKMPSARDVIEYRRGFLRSVDLPYGRQEITVNLAAAGALYKKLCEASEGYAAAVPSGGVAGAALPAVSGVLVAAPGRVVRAGAVPGRAGGRRALRHVPARPAGCGRAIGGRSPAAEGARFARGIAMGIQVTLDDIAADEFQAMAILDEEREKWEKERQGK